MRGIDGGEGVVEASIAGSVAASIAASVAALVLAAGCGARPSGFAAGLGAPVAAGTSGSAPIPHVGLAGFEAGMYTLRSDEFSALFDDGMYFGVRYSQELGLNLACSISAGYFRADSKMPDGDRLETFPIRVTIEIGSYLGPTYSRWYLGGGGGYNLTEAHPTGDEIALWPEDMPYLDNESTAHAVLGFEFRNETFVATRFEAGHTWLLESHADLWTATGTFAFQF